MKQISAAIFSVVKRMPVREQEYELRNNALHHAKNEAEAEEIFNEVKEALIELAAEYIAQKYRVIKELDNQKKTLETMKFTNKN